MKPLFLCAGLVLAWILLGDFLERPMARGFLLGGLVGGASVAAVGEWRRMFK